MSFSSTLQTTLSLSASRMYTSIYAFEYLVNLNSVLLNPGLVCGSCKVDCNTQPNATQLNFVSHNTPKVYIFTSASYVVTSVEREPYV
jgi:hypothetical protein